MKKVSPGDPIRIPAATWNNLTEVADWWTRSQAIGRAAGGGIGGGRTIRVRNTSGSTRDRGNILQIGDIEEGELDRRFLWFTGEAPNATWDKRICVLLDPAVNNTFARAEVLGLVTAEVNVANTSHTTCKVAANTYVLQSDFDGPIPIIYQPGNTNTQTCVVVLPPMLPYKPTIEFALSAAMTTSDATKTATIQSQDGIGLDNPNTGSGAITVHNVREHTASTYIFEGDSGDRGVASWLYGNEYKIENMECP